MFYKWKKYIVLRSGNYNFRWLLFLCLLASAQARASVGICLGGNWNSGLSWSFGGVNRPPVCGDTLIVPAGITVTVSSTVNYTSCTQPFFISIEGTIDFTNGSRLDLPCSSAIVLTNTGQLTKSTPGGGNSAYIHMCGCVAWQASMGNITTAGPLTCSVLPVSLLFFDAKPGKGKVEITWATATEMNNDRFEIERSGDGKNFNMIVSVDGCGTCDVRQDYIFDDINPPNGIIYYRLKQTDYDGKSDYSDVTAINYRSGEQSITGCYSSSDKMVSVILNGSFPSIVHLQISDSYGKEILAREIDTTDTHILQIRNDLKPGNYFIRLSYEGVILTSRFMVNQ